MGFYLNVRPSVATLHTDQCKQARDWAEAARLAGADTWLWFDTYFACLVKVVQERKEVSLHLACAPKPDALTDQVLALYEALRTG